MRFLSRFVCGIAAALAFTMVAHAGDYRPPKQWVYVGTYTNAKNGSKGIYRYDFDPATGKLTPAGLAAEAVNPSFLAIHPSGKYLFAVGEFNAGPSKAIGVAAYRINPETGTLAFINGRASEGVAPCHVTVDKAGKNAIVANYGSGSVAVFEIGEDGALSRPTDVIQHAGKGPDPKRQEGPHAHSTTLDPANHFAIVADLGLDELEVYHFNPVAGVRPRTAAGHAGRLTLASTNYHTAPGAGPRHFAFHPDGKRAYVINELNSTLSTLDYDAAHGALTQRQTVSTLPAGWKGNSTCAEVVVHPSGKFVYGSNRGHDSIAAFAIEPDGKLKLIGHQGEGVKTPRNFNIDPSGKWMIVANQDGNSLVVFKIDQQTGALSPTGVKADVGGPVCVKFWPAPR
jgi:6-phosphogluconolactonase